MKKIILLNLMLLISLVSLSQTLKQNEIDEFTNNSIKRTSWETLNMTMKFAAYFRLSNINGESYFDLKMMIGSKVFSIDKNQELMIKLSDGEIVKLPNLKFATTCKGCGAKGISGSGAQGIQVSYPITKNQIEKLKTGKGNKIRIYTNDGYVENDMKMNIYKKIVKALALIE
ncbi:hypothetical protein R9C00_14730 [Flammeovirgaceae bacterium SG7u.111]|nr:hypothetical protein [Flammeovirgaceae bacterium SG7u.132]WPO38714.1 hypothetical protein R9C00_14730 [Flammeovirgaceae bacterium SG7u.111]